MRQVYFKFHIFFISASSFTQRRWFFSTNKSLIKLIGSGSKQKILLKVFFFFFYSKASLFSLSFSPDLFYYLPCYITMLGLLDTFVFNSTINTTLVIGFSFAIVYYFVFGKKTVKIKFHFDTFRIEEEI
jgi:hypothetical protein